MITSRTRIIAASLAQGLALVSLLTTPMAFSGSSERHVKFVAMQIAHLWVAGGLVAFALVVSVPVCWRGHGWQRLVAAVLIGFNLWVFYKAAEEQYHRQTVSDTPDRKGLLLKERIARHLLASNAEPLSK